MTFYTRPAIAIIVLLLAGCANEQRLRSRLDSYLHAGGNESVDDKSNQDAICCLLVRMEPLDRPERINLVLDVFLYYDATDNLAQGLAHDILRRHPHAVLPEIRRRLPSEPNREVVETLIVELEGRG
ncbi:MAG: hypothetical protein WD042_06910 [Phycisphaeraceae bacterium]